jgi:hypothetical protein
MDGDPRDSTTVESDDSQYRRSSDDVVLDAKVVNVVGVTFRFFFVFWLLVGLGLFQISPPDWNDATWWALGFPKRKIGARSRCRYIIYEIVVQGRIFAASWQG